MKVHFAAVLVGCYVLMSVEVFSMMPRISKNIFPILFSLYVLDFFGSFFLGDALLRFILSVFLEVVIKEDTVDDMVLWLKLLKFSFWSITSSRFSFNSFCAGSKLYCSSATIYFNLYVLVLICIFPNFSLIDLNSLYYSLSSRVVSLETALPLSLKIFELSIEFFFRSCGIKPDCYWPLPYLDFFYSFDIF